MWRKSKVIYTQIIDREPKTTTECYLHESVSLGDVEYQCAQHLKRRISTGIEMVDSAAKVKFTHVIFHGMQDDDRFYEVKMTEWDGEKKHTYTYLLPAVSPEQAIERMTAFVGESVSDWRVVNIKESDIMAVWNESSELWTGDWWNRMDRYDDEGKHDRGTSVDPEEEEGEKPKLDLFGEVVPTKKGRSKAQKIYGNMLKKMRDDGVTVSVKGPKDADYRQVN